MTKNEEVGQGRIRLSYTILDLWGRGNPDAVVQTYFHLPRESSPAMEAGKQIHNEIAEHIEKTKKFPEYLRVKYPLELPKPEQELIVRYNDFFDLKCYIDCLDNDTIFEFKTGTTDSLEWARTDQIPLYFLICELSGIPVKRAFLIHYNQYTDKADFCIIHNTKDLIERARNLVDSVGPDILQFFLEKGLL